MKPLLAAVGMIAVALSATMAGIHLASASNDHEKARELQRAGKILPLEQVLDRAHESAAGKIIEAELHRTGQRYWYEIELLQADGTVLELHLDASTGELLGSEREH